MRVPIKWLSRYVDLNGVDIDWLCESLTMRGLEVDEKDYVGYDIRSVVVGRIDEIVAHQDSDHLLVCQMDVGKPEKLQVVTGAPNLTVGDLVPVALHGSELPGGVKIKSGKLRGVLSQGMLCSGAELCLKDEDYAGAEADGILILNEEYPLGMDLVEALDLSDVVLITEPTSNRPDLQSMIGVAREVAAILDRPLMLPDLTLKEDAGSSIADHAKVDVLDSQGCPRYMARSVKQINIAPSPMWMRRVLRAAGQRPINNIVDITNFVMIESGQPMHAFDLSCVADHHIIVRRNNKDEKIVTLDGKTRDLPDNTLLITDKNKAVGIAGIMGGENSEITDSSETVLFESAVFDGVSIRHSSKAMGLLSEAAIHYVRGVDVDTAAWALERACQLVEELNAGKVESGVIDVCDKEILQKKVLVARPERVNALLSTDVSVEKMAEILNSLFIPTTIEEGKLRLVIPQFRNDMEGEADVAEEIGRVIGHSSITPTLMVGDLMRGRLNEKQQWMDKLRDMLCGQGVYECVTYSFTGPSTYDKLLIEPGNPLRDCVVLRNPFGEDNSWMRSTLITGMLPVLSVNYKRNTGDVRFYEVGRVHLNARDGQELPPEFERVCIGFIGEDDNFYSIKGAIDALANSLDVKGLTYKAGGEAFFHPGRKAIVQFGDKIIGQVGELHPNVAKSFDLPERVYIAELDLAALYDCRILEKQYRELPRFPAVNRDLALIVSKDIESATVEAAIRSAAGTSLESLRLFDIYEGSNLLDNNKSLAYRLCFRDMKKTLTDDEVQSSISNILDALKKSLNIELRK